MEDSVAVQKLKIDIDNEIAALNKKKFECQEAIKLNKVMLRSCNIELRKLALLRSTYK